jgi:hypothetical protein
MMNAKTIHAAAALMWLAAGTLMAQKAADPTARYHRLAS